MPEYVVTSRRYPKFSVRIGECTPEHAQSVYDQLLVEPTAPTDLALTEVGQPPVKRGLLARLGRR